MYGRFVQMFEAVMVSIMTAAAGFISIYVNNDCKPMTENSKELHVRVCAHRLTVLFFCENSYCGSFPLRQPCSLYQKEDNKWMDDYKKLIFFLWNDF